MSVYFANFIHEGHTHAQLSTILGLRCNEERVRTETVKEEECGHLC